MKGLRAILLILCLVLCPVGRPCAAEPLEHSAKPLAVMELDPEKVDVKGIVLHHIEDTYGWHITNTRWGEWYIPLPVILHSPTSGWQCFSSQRIVHGATYEGFYVAEEGPYAGKIVERMTDGSERRPLDLSLTKTAAGVLINSVLVIALILGVARWYRRRKADDPAPRGLVGAVEMLISSLIDDIIRPCIGPRYRRFAPFLLTLFFFIFVNNLIGLIPLFPAGTNVTGNITVTLVLALSTFLVVNLFGTKHYWRDVLWPEVPTWLKVPLPIMPLIEMIGLFTKPFALMIRLFANIMAGHAVILILTCIVFATVRMGEKVNASMSAVSVFLSIFMFCLELLVAFLQAYVFTMLSSVFIGLAQEGGEHEEN